MTMFRCDVVLRVDTASTAQRHDEAHLYRKIDWQADGMTLSRLRQELLAHQHGDEAALPYLVTSVPNARLLAAVRTQEWLHREDCPRTVGELRTVLQSGTEGIDPEDMRVLGAEPGYAVAIGWSQQGDNSCFDALFGQGEISLPLKAWEAVTNEQQMQVATELAHRTAWGSYANNPLRGKLIAQLVSELRPFLKETLPEYMTPAAFVFLDALPLTPNGKVDRAALPAPGQERPELETTYVAPRNWVEETLTEIWALVLHIEQVGIHDNFFELGGDSILSIQVIARAAKVGVQLTPKQLFERQTIAALAAVADTTAAMRVERTIMMGEIPLTPIQCWFFEQQLPDPHLASTTLLFEAREVLDATLLKQVVHSLVVYHEVLRLRFVQGKTGWQQLFTEPNAEATFSYIDLSTLPSATRNAALESATVTLRRRLNLAQGPLAQVVLFHIGPEKPDHLLLIMHYLLADSYSWTIMVDDLQTAYRQLGRGEAISLPPRTTSFHEWASHGQAYAQSEAWQREQAYWLAQAENIRTQVEYLPTGAPATDPLTGATCTFVQALTAEETLWFEDVTQAYHTRPGIVLLTVLAQTCSQWTGQGTLLVDLEDDLWLDEIGEQTEHGRLCPVEVATGVDFAHTIGQFARLFPILLDVGAEDTAALLRTIKKQVLQVPNLGIGYGMLRYLNRDETVTTLLRDLPQAQVHFSYRQHVDLTQSEAALFHPAHNPDFGTKPPEGQHYPLALTGYIAEERLHLEWTYNEQLYRRKTIEKLAEYTLDTLHLLVAQNQSPAAGDYTPADFPLAGLSQEELDELRTVFNKGME